jgi:CBS domain containing-hemolysin-like protein
MMARLERIPEVGDSVEVDGVGLTVARMRGRRVLALTVTPPPEEDESEEEDR